MPTYKDVQREVKEACGFVPKTCWIAHVLSEHGKTTRTAPNRISKTSRVYPCPPDKKKAVERILREFKMI